MDTKMMLLGALGLLGVVALRGKSEAAPATTYGGAPGPTPAIELDPAAPSGAAVPTNVLQPTAVVRAQQETLNKFRTRLLAAQQHNYAGKTYEPFVASGDCSSSGALATDGLYGTCTLKAAAVTGEIMAAAGYREDDIGRLVGSSYPATSPEWARLAQVSLALLGGLSLELPW
jgi:hypothetical protein